MTEPTAKVVAGMQAGFRIGKQIYVKVVLAERYPHGATSVGQLGDDLVVQPRRIIEAILSNEPELRAVNGPILEQLFLDQAMAGDKTFAGLAKRPHVSLRDKQEVLRELAFGTHAWVKQISGDGKRERTPDYYSWPLLPTGTVAVPLSAGMVDVIERSRRWTAVRHDVEAFEKELDKLATDVITLRTVLSSLVEVGKSGLHEVAMLVALSQYCDLLLDQQGNPEPGESPLADLQEFLQRSAVPVFINKLVSNPTDIVPKLCAAREQAARNIMGRLTNPKFVAGVKDVVRNHDIVPHELLDELYHYLTAAADLLSVTAHAEAFAKTHALPLMRGLAELPDPAPDPVLATITHEELRGAMSGGWRSVLTDGESVYKLAMGVGTGVIGSVSNLAGPRSVGVAVLMQYQIYLFQKGAKEYSRSIAAFDRAANLFIKNFGEISEPKHMLLRSGFADAAARGTKVNLKDLMKDSGLDVTRGPYRGRVTRGTMALLATSLVGLTFAANDDDSPSTTFAKLSLGGTTAVAVLDWTPISSAMERRWGASVGMATGRLAALTGAFGLVSSAFGLKSAYDAGDDLGMLEGALGTLGSISSLGGWAFCARAGALAFAPSIAMTMGSVLVLAGLGVGIWRTFAIQRPLDVVNATLEYFRDPSSRASIADLEPTIETLEDLVRLVTFRPLSLKYKPALAGLGYDDDIVAIFTGTT